MDAGTYAPNCDDESWTGDGDLGQVGVASWYEFGDSALVRVMVADLPSMNGHIAAAYLTLDQAEALVADSSGPSATHARMAAPPAGWDL